jgi:hypothetical protein
MSWCLVGSEMCIRDSVSTAPKDKAFVGALDDELHRMSVFLKLNEA